MVNLAKVDRNFVVDVVSDKSSLVFYDIEQEPFRIYGVTKEQGYYRRMPEAIARTVSEGVYKLHTNTAGGRVRFVSNSMKVAIHAKIDGIPRHSHMPLTGDCGLDMYVKEEAYERYAGTFIPPYGIQTGYESEISFVGKKERLITINFPLYSNLKNLYIGLDKDAYVKSAPDYACERPVVYYGSSITQGACASRPGNCYEHILTRKLNCDHLNLGFSGNAKAEEAMIEYISNLDMAAFVLDYDHNAPSVEYLEMTHERSFRRIREKHPMLPVIMLSRPRYFLLADDVRRAEIIRRTFEHALAEGDQNVYFLDGPMLMADIGDDGTVDCTHPNDSGFVSMSRAIEPVLGRLVKEATKTKP